MTLKPSFYEMFGLEQILENISVDIARNHLWEQFCIVDITKGLLIITGCAHPGLEKILQIKIGVSLKGMQFLLNFQDLGIILL